MSRIAKSAVQTESVISKTHSADEGEEGPAQYPEGIAREKEDEALAAWVESERLADFEQFAKDARREITKILNRTILNGFATNGWFDNSDGHVRIGIDLRPLKENA